MTIFTTLKKTLAFLLIFENFSCYVYSSKLKIRNENDFTPGIKNITLKIVTAKDQIDALIQSGFDLSLRLSIIYTRLEKGALTCLVFVDKELASMECAATNAAAKQGIDIYPCKIDFDHKEAYAGGVWTNPKYRGKGLHLYAYYKIYDYLREQGIVTVKSIVEVHNTAALKAHARFAPEEKIEAKAHYLRLLGLHFWWRLRYKQAGAKAMDGGMPNGDMGDTHG